MSAHEAGEESPEADEQDLIRSCQAGDRQAFVRLYQANAQSVFRVCCALVHDRSDAEDLLQGVFIEAFRKIDRFDYRGPIRAWLHGIAWRLSANVRRGRKRRLRLLEAYGSAVPTGPDLEALADARRALSRMNELLRKVSEPKRTAFLLRHAAGLSLSEIALAMNTSAQTAFARLNAARKELVLMLGSRKGGMP